MRINRGTILLYRIKFFILTFLFLLIGVKPVLAGDPPSLLTPTNNTIVASSRLEWQTPPYPVCSSSNAYRIQVDDDPSFPSSDIYRNTYTKNSYYTPQLTYGNWYWRVMARDETCSNWSEWSSVWSFTLIEPTPTPTPTPSPTLTPSPTPSPTPTKTPSPTSAPKKTATPTSISTPTPATKSTPIPSSSKTESSSQPKGSNEISYRIASVAGAQASASTSATPEAKVEVKNQKQTNPFLWIGLILIFAGAGAIGYIYLKKNAKI